MAVADHWYTLADRGSGSVVDGIAVVHMSFAVAGMGSDFAVACIAVVHISFAVADRMSSGSVVACIAVAVVHMGFAVAVHMSSDSAEVLFLIPHFASCFAGYLIQHSVSCSADCCAVNFDLHVALIACSVPATIHWYAVAIL